MRLLHQYIRRQIISSTLLVMANVLGIQSFLDFVSQLPDIGVIHYTLLKAIAFVPLQLPFEFYQLFPMAGFLGCLIGLGKLAGTSELIVMRSAGLSISKITFSVIKTALIMIFVVTLIGEGLAPHWQSTANQIRLSSLGRLNGLGIMKGLWLQQGNTFANIGFVLTPENVFNMTFFEFDKDHHLNKALFAKHVVVTNNQWQLFDVASTTFSETKTTASKDSYLAQKGQMLNPTRMYKAQRDTNEESIWDLFRAIIYRRKMGLLSSQFEFAFWQRMVQPLTTIVMICFGIPFIFGSLRQSGMGVKMLMGIIVGFCFYMLNQFLGPFTLVYQFPAVISALLPTMIFFIIYLFLMRRIA